ncbi:MAG: hypothetical protein ACR2HP_15870 [Ilumatobacteraceae bacterium]
MRSVTRSSTGRLGLALAGIIVVSALVSLVWTPYDPSRIDPSQR